MKNKKNTQLIEYIFALSLALLTFFFYSLVINTEEKYFTVPLSVKVHSGFIFTKKLPASVSVLLRGSRASLARININNIAAGVDFSLYNSQGAYTEAVQVIRSGIFQDMNNIETEVSPSSIEGILEEKKSKEIRVIPVFYNTPPPEYDFNGYIVNPSVITVTGPHSVLLDLYELNTQEINLANERDNFTSTVEVHNEFTDTDIVLEPKEVEVLTRIKRVITVSTIDGIAIDIINLSPQLRVGSKLPSATLIIRGSTDRISRYAPNISIDAEFISEQGTYTLIPQVNPVRNIEIISLSPTKVTLNIENTESSTTKSPTLTTIDFPQNLPVDSLSPPADTDVTEVDETTSESSEASSEPSETDSEPSEEGEETEVIPEVPPVPLQSP